MLIPVFLLLAFAMLLIFNRPATRVCRWREYRQGDSARWTCVQCGATVMGKNGQRPQDCHRKDPAA